MFSNPSPVPSGTAGDAEWKNLTPSTKIRKFNQMKRKFAAYACSTPVNEPEVKSTSMLQESGEWEATLNDLKYHLDGLQPSHDVNVRFTSASQLALACNSAQKRMLLRSHGGIKTCFECMKDIHIVQDSMLQLCMLTILYFFLKDRQHSETLPAEMYGNLVDMMIQELGCNSSKSPSCSPSSSTSSSPDTSKKPKRALKRGKKRKSKGMDNLQVMDDIQQMILLEEETADIAMHGVPLTSVDLILLVLDYALQVENGPEVSSSSLSGSGAKSCEQEILTIVARRKEILRERGGLKVLCEVVKKICITLQAGDRKSARRASLESLRRTHYSLRLLEHASFVDAGTQNVLTDAQNGLIPSLLGMIEAIREDLLDPMSSRHSVLRNSMLASLRVLINITNETPRGATQVAAAGGMKTLFETFVQGNNSANIQRKNTTDSESSNDKFSFDLLLLILSLVTNCVETNDSNRTELSSVCSGTTSVCLYFVRYFLTIIQSYMTHLTAAKADGTELRPSVKSGNTNGQTLPPNDEPDWSVEDLILGGSTSLLLGCLMRNNTRNAAVILGALPSGSSFLLIRVLEAYIALHSQMGILTKDVLQSVLQVIHELKGFSQEQRNEQQHVEKRTETETFIGSGPDEIRDTAAFKCNEKTSSPMRKPIARNLAVETPPASAFRLNSTKRSRRSGIEETDESPNEEDQEPENGHLDTPPPRRKKLRIRTKKLDFFSSTPVEQDVNPSSFSQCEQTAAECDGTASVDERTKKRSVSPWQRVSDEKPESPKKRESSEEVKVGERLKRESCPPYNEKPESPKKRKTSEEVKVGHEQDSTSNGCKQRVTRRSSRRVSTLNNGHSNRCNTQKEKPIAHKASAGRKTKPKTKTKTKTKMGLKGGKKTVKAAANCAPTPCTDVFDFDG